MYNSRQTVTRKIVWDRLWKPLRPLFAFWLFILWKSETWIHTFNHLNIRARFQTSELGQLSEARETIRKLKQIIETICYQKSFDVKILKKLNVSTKFEKRNSERKYRRKKVCPRLRALRSRIVTRASFPYFSIMRKTFSGVRYRKKSYMKHFWKKDVWWHQFHHFQRKIQKRHNLQLPSYQISYSKLPCFVLKISTFFGFISAQKKYSKKNFRRKKS